MVMPLRAYSYSGRPLMLERGIHGRYLAGFALNDSPEAAIELFRCD